MITRHRIARWGLPAAIATAIVVAFLARAWAYFLRPVWLHPTSYDDGVYFAAAAAWVRGFWPYRDFTLVHPPGLLLGYALPAIASKWIGIRSGFVAARWFACGIGAGVAGLVALAGGRLKGTTAALIAGLAYALYPEAAEQDRSVYLEPLLNLCCVGASIIWLVRDERSPRTRAALAGSLFGVALLVKLWAAPWIALAVLCGLLQRRRETGILIVAGLLTVIVIGAPFVLHAPAEFADQVWWMQLRRPPDGMARSGRPFAMIEQHKLLSAIAWVSALIAAATALASRKRLPEFLYWCGALTLVAAMFLSAKAYWNVYNGHLAAPECVVAGVAIAVAVEAIAKRFRQPKLAPAFAIVSAVCVLLPMARANRAMLRATDADTPKIGDFLQEHVPASECVAALEPAAVLAGNRLPGVTDGAPALIDSYGAMLATGTAERRSQAIGDAFAAPSAQEFALRSLAACPYLLLGWREDFQLTPETKAALHARYVPMGDSLPASAVFRRKEP